MRCRVTRMYGAGVPSIAPISAFSFGLQPSFVFTVRFAVRFAFLFLIRVHIHIRQHVEHPPPTGASRRTLGLPTLTGQHYYVGYTPLTGGKTIIAKSKTET